MSIARTLLHTRPPQWLSQLEVRLLMRACLQAGAQVGITSVKAPTAYGLETFRSLTEDLARATQDNGTLRLDLMHELGIRAEKLGRMARRVLFANTSDAFVIMRFLYQGIGIEIEGHLPGTMKFTSCFFAQTYSKDTCCLMRAMDEGVMRGLAGGGNLTFSARITEGCNACTACFVRKDTHE